MDSSPAGVRNAAARRLLGRGRLREALDVLNEAIRLDPRFADSYENRALVFEQMGMFPQAAADRRKAADLVSAQRPQAVVPPSLVDPAPLTPLPTPDVAASPEPLPEDFGPAPDEEPLLPPAVGGEMPVDQSEPSLEPGSFTGEPPPPEVGQVRAPVVPRYQVRRRGGGSGAALQALGIVLITVGLFVAAGVGIFVALDTLDSVFSEDDSPPGASNQTPGEGEQTNAVEVTPTRNPETPEEALQGDPVSFTRMETAWQEKGIEAEPGEVNDDITGFSTTPVDVILSRDGETMDVAVLLYDSPSSVSQDWDLAQSPAPRPGRDIPAGSFVWYNLNAVVVVLDPNDAIRGDALDAFLAITA